MTGLRAIDGNGHVPANIGTLTTAEVGWRRFNGGHMRWINPKPASEGAGRDVIELKGHRDGLLISTAWLPPEIDPADDEAVTGELEGEGWPALLPLPALIVLRFALDSAITAMEAAQGITIDLGDETP